MLVLILIWLLIGILAGLLATAGRLQPSSWSRRGWLYMAGIGAATAFCGGLLGTFLLGRYFATAMALWIAVTGVVLLPRLASLRKSQKTT
ncbi:MAG TPA: hypothetical protein VKY19_09100 [Ktedonosporobacter sp.]|jgi:uncharacterized membrane protein YeaQ/YmgE (transglycosylase-associated protein family)|nr:hypothetical protein [Ktedonosporobacter sp.]